MQIAAAGKDRRKRIFEGGSEWKAEEHTRTKRKKKRKSGGARGIKGRDYSTIDKTEKEDGRRIKEGVRGTRGRVGVHRARWVQGKVGTALNKKWTEGWRETGAVVITEGNSGLEAFVVVVGVQ